MAQIPRPTVAPVIWAQIIVLLIVLTVTSIVDRAALPSALAGGMVALIPNIFFAWWMFRFRGARQAKRAVKAFYGAEAGKFGLTVVLFAASFAWVRPLNPIFIFVAYCVVLFVHWLSPWLLARKRHP